jgi:hypothetical protein
LGTQGRRREEEGGGAMGRRGLTSEWEEEEIELAVWRRG